MKMDIDINAIEMAAHDSNLEPLFELFSDIMSSAGKHSVARFIKDIPISNYELECELDLAAEEQEKAEVKYEELEEHCQTFVANLMSIEDKNDLTKAIEEFLKDAPTKLQSNAMVEVNLVLGSDEIESDELDEAEVIPMVSWKARNIATKLSKTQKETLLDENARLVPDQIHKGTWKVFSRLEICNDKGITPFGEDVRQALTVLHG